MSGRCASRVAVAIAVCLLVGARARAQAPAGCPAGFATWAAACDARGDAPRLLNCPTGHAIYTVGPGALRVDVARSSERTFVSVGPLGASPIGEFPDWDAVPAADRAAFDALVDCMRERPDPLVEALEQTPTGLVSRSHDAPEGSRPPAGPWPWRFTLAALIALGLAVRRFGLRTVGRRATPLLALSAVTMLARQLLVPVSYFHQNGQGPFWVAHALGEPSSYGPGYAQVFYWAASDASDPDGAVFLVQAILCAVVPAAVFVVVRGVGVHRMLAVGGALAVAVSPLLARIAQGESYFATCGALLAIAAAVVAGARPDAKLADNAAAGVAAGLLVAQAALIHPVCWCAAALLPIVVLVGPGELGPRLRLTALFTAVVALVVVFAAGADMLAVLRGPLGAQWLGPTEHHPRTMPFEIRLAAMAAVGALVLAVLRRRFRKGAIAAAALGAILVVGWFANLLGSAPAWVIDAYRWLYVGPFAAVLAALVRELVARTKASKPKMERGALAAGTALVLAGALAWHGVDLEGTLRVPTDAQEAMRLRAWRAHLPPGAVVAHLERAGNQIVGVPLYAFRTVRLRADEEPVDLTAAGRDVFLYRPGLCTTSRGRAFCDAIDEAYVVHPLHRAVLPAVPSMEGLDYDRPEVEVGLYRVRDRRSGSTTPERSSEGRDGR